MKVWNKGPCDIVQGSTLNVQLSSIVVFFFSLRRKFNAVEPVLPALRCLSMINCQSAVIVVSSV